MILNKEWNTVWHICLETACKNRSRQDEIMRKGESTGVRFSVAE